MFIEWLIKLQPLTKREIHSIVSLFFYWNKGIYNQGKLQRKKYFEIVKKRIQPYILPSVNSLTFIFLSWFISFKKFEILPPEVTKRKKLAALLWAFSVLIPNQIQFEWEIEIEKDGVLLKEQAFLSEFGTLEDIQS